MKVSVIIPVYNQLKYIKRCIESVLDQTYKNIEVLLVDDGSTDGSEKLCDQYAMHDNRIKVIHKDNGGLSSARNVGMDCASGEYITFLDSDDYLAMECIENMLNLCMNYNADISIMRMKYVGENINAEINDLTDEHIQHFSPQEAIEESLYQKLFSCCAPGKMYCKSVLAGISFPVNRLSEDLAVCHLIFNNAKKIVFSNIIAYYYRQQPQSIMHVFNPKRLDALEWAHNIESFCEMNYPNLVPAAKCRTFNVAIHLVLDLPTKDENLKKNEKELMADIKRTRMTVLFNNKARFREKAAVLLSLISLQSLRFVWNSKIAIKENGN